MLKLSSEKRNLLYKGKFSMIKMLKMLKSVTSKRTSKNQAKEDKEQWHFKERNYCKQNKANLEEL